MVHFPGTPSDDVADLLATGGTEVTTIFVAMAARSPAGDDADYLAWHALDHRPEVARVAALQGAQRLVSTPACRAARVAGDGRYDAVDHVMTYLFRSPDGPRALGAVAAALAGAGRMAPRLPTVEIATYELVGTAAAPRVLVGADVIAWRPARGVFLLVERGAPSPATLVDVPGVAGVWWYRGTPDQPAGADVDGLQISYCYLDEHPVVTAEHLRPALEPRWSAGGGTPLLAAPFHVPVDFAWDRHLP